MQNEHVFDSNRRGIEDGALHREVNPQAADVTGFGHRHVPAIEYSVSYDPLGCCVLRTHAATSIEADRAVFRGQRPRSNAAILAARAKRFQSVVSGSDLPCAFRVARANAG
jgi:hypothetical protein